MKKLIIFVCNGNIHRSVIAAQCLRNVLKDKELNSRFLVDSYGLQGTRGTELPKHKRLSDYPKEWKAAKPTLDRLGINISRHSFKKISADIMKKATVVIAMDDKVYSRAKNSLKKQFPKYTEKIHRFSELTVGYRVVKDPFGISDVDFHGKIIQDIYSTICKKYKDILAWIG